jgi:hypothetical protein
MFQMRGVRDFCDQNVHGVHCGNKNLSQQSRWNIFVIILQSRESSPSVPD